MYCAASIGAAVETPHWSQNLALSRRPVPQEPHVTPAAIRITARTKVEFRLPKYGDFQQRTAAIRFGTKSSFAAGPYLWIQRVA